MKLSNLAFYGMAEIIIWEGVLFDNYQRISIASMIKARLEITPPPEKNNNQQRRINQQTKSLGFEHSFHWDGYPKSLSLFERLKTNNEKTLTKI